MWKSGAGSGGGPHVAQKNGSNGKYNTNDDDDDDWETDPDYINDLSEQEQRWGGTRSGGAIE